MLPALAIALLVLGALFGLGAALIESVTEDDASGIGASGALLMFGGLTLLFVIL